MEPRDLCPDRMDIRHDLWFSTLNLSATGFFPFHSNSSTATDISFTCTDMCDQPTGRSGIPRVCVCLAHAAMWARDYCRLPSADLTALQIIIIWGSGACSHVGDEVPFTKVWNNTLPPLWLSLANSFRRANGDCWEASQEGFSISERPINILLMMVTTRCKSCQSHIKAKRVNFRRKAKDKTSSN